MSTKSLLALAQEFDQIDANELEARVEAALKVQTALGDRYGEFDDRYMELVGRDPACASAAATVIAQMGLA